MSAAEKRAGPELVTCRQCGAEIPWGDCIAVYRPVAPYAKDGVTIRRELIGHECTKHRGEPLPQPSSSPTITVSHGAPPMASVESGDAMTKCAVRFTSQAMGRNYVITSKPKLGQPLPQVCGAEPSPPSAALRIAVSASLVERLLKFLDTKAEPDRQAKLNLMYELWAAQRSAEAKAEKVAPQPAPNPDERSQVVERAREYWHKIWFPANARQVDRWTPVEMADYFAADFHLSEQERK